MDSFLSLYARKVGGYHFKEQPASLKVCTITKHNEYLINWGMFKKGGKLTVSFKL